MALPSGVGEGLLLLIVGGGFALVWRSIRRRKAFASALADSELPNVATDIRFRVRARRLWRDSASGLPLAEVDFAGRKLVVCPVDHERNAGRWGLSAGKAIDIALFGLATLKPGGADAMRGQIRDFDESVSSPDVSVLIRQGETPCDYVLIGRLLSSRQSDWDGMALTVWRVQCVFTAENGVVFEASVPTEGSDPGLVAGAMAHGSVRLFAYLAD